MSTSSEQGEARGRRLYEAPAIASEATLERRALACGENFFSDAEELSCKDSGQPTAST